MSNLLGPRDANGIPVPMSVDESIARMKTSLLKNIKRSAYVYRVDCGGCNGCEIEIFATLSPLFDAERFGIKVVPSPRHADILLFTGAVEAGGALITPHQANVPVVLDGVGIMPGDYVLADGSGAVIIPGAEIDEVLLGATAVKQEDARFREQIAQERASAGESARGARER